jgi:hypothetical protein
MRCLFKTGALRSGAYHRSPGFHSTPQLDNWHESTDNKISLNKIRRYVEQLIVRWLQRKRFLEKFTDNDKFQVMAKTHTTLWYALSIEDCVPTDDNKYKKKNHNFYYKKNTFIRSIKTFSYLVFTYIFN